MAIDVKPVKRSLTVVKIYYVLKNRLVHQPA